MVAENLGRNVRYVTWALVIRKRLLKESTNENVLDMYWWRLCRKGSEQSRTDGGGATLYEGSNGEKTSNGFVQSEGGNNETESDNNAMLTLFQDPYSLRMYQMCLSLVWDLMREAQLVDGSILPTVRLYTWIGRAVESFSDVVHSGWASSEMICHINL